jgi:HKD family nuclease
MSNEAELIKSLYSGFIDKEGESLEKYCPKLIVNNHLKGQKVLSSIIRELKNCDEFFISVAFITQSGVITLINTLLELENHNIKGKIIASQYMNFTEPKALKRLLAFKNIELRIVQDGNLHSKGYIFRKKDTYSLIVGSSNLTQNALSYNKEWNMKVSSMEKGSLIQETLVEFKETFEQAILVDQQWIDAYSGIYSNNKRFRLRNLVENESKRAGCSAVADEAHDYKGSIELLAKIMPNKMQLRALEGIEAVRNQGETWALIISATGTGKTYLSAFDVKKVKPKKFLFLAHREQILDQSIESYKQVLGTDFSYGKLCGGFKEVEADYLFSTIQSMSKASVLTSFLKDAFDYIVIDESHRAGSETYQRIIKYFQPKFLLGMTATPERTDSYNICADFDYNIAYEIRLQEALYENMLCPLKEMVDEGKIGLYGGVDLSYMLHCNCKSY